MFVLVFSLILASLLRLTVVDCWSCACGPRADLVWSCGGSNRLLSAAKLRGVYLCSKELALVASLMCIKAYLKDLVLSHAKAIHFQHSLSLKAEGSVKHSEVYHSQS